jgi:hypothetical protein
MNALALPERPAAKEEHLETLIQRRLFGRVKDFRLLIRREGLVLQGHTNTYHAKQLAQHAVMELADRPILSNEIEVR